MRRRTADSPESRRQSAQAQVAQVTTGSMGTQEFVRRLGELLPDLLPCDAFLLGLYDAERDTLIHIGGFDTVSDRYGLVEIPATQVNVCSEMASTVLVGRRPWLLHRSGAPTAGHTDERFGDVSRQSESILFAPLISGNRVIGVISTQSYKSNAYTPEDVDLLVVVAQQAGPALEAVLLTERLAASEARYRDALAQIDAVPYQLDFRTKQYTFVGEGIEMLTGVPAAQFRPEVWHGLIEDHLMLGESAGMTDVEAGRSLAQGHIREWRCDCRIRTRDGRALWILDCAVPLFDASGATIGSFGILQDISDRKAMEEGREALRRLSQRLAAPLTLQELGEAVAEESRRLFGHDAFALAGVDASGLNLNHIHFEDTAPGGDAPVPVPPPNRTFPIRDSLVADGLPHLVNRDSTPPSSTALRFGFTERASRSIMISPILWQERVVGLVAAQSYTPNRFGPADFDLFKTFALHVGGALARLLAEKRLREREMTLTALTYAIPDMVVRQHRDGTYLDITPGLGTPTYRPVSEVVGRNMREIMPPELVALAIEKHERAFETGEMQIYEFQLPIEGVPRDFESRVAVCATDEVLILVRDITARKRAEVEAAALHRLSQRLSESLTITRLGTVTAEECCKLFQCEAFDLTHFDEVRGVSRQIICLDTPIGAAEPIEFPPVTHPIAYFRDGPRACILEGKPFLISRRDDPEPSSLRPMGEVRRVSRSIMSVPVTWSGRPIGILSVQSYTPGRWGEADLALLGTIGSLCAGALVRVLHEEELLLLATAVEQSEAGVIVIDRGWNIQYANPTLERALRTTADRLIGKPRSSLPWDTTSPEQFTEIRRTTESGATWRGHQVMDLPDGNHCHHHIAITPIRDNAGTITHFLELRRDVTKETMLEAQLRHAQKMEAVGQLAGGVAHDFNNLLQGILGFAEVALLEAKAGEPVLESIQEIRQAGQRASTLTKQLLAFSRRQLLKPVTLDLRQILGGLMKLIRRLLPESIEITVEASDDLSCVQADPGQIEQALVNLCLNARDAMPAGGQLTIQARDVLVDEPAAKPPLDLTPGPHVVLSVTDTGTGMTPEVRERIFEPFFTTKRHGQGSGLGLAMVYGIVRQHAGAIDVQTEPGHGSTFSIYLPAQAGEPTQEDKAQTDSSMPGGNETILLAEDEDLVRGFAASALRRHGYTVLAAHDGKEAVDIFAENEESIAIAVLDAIMPRMSGRDACEAIRARRPDLPIIMASGHIGDLIDHEFLERNHVAFIGKPYSLASFLQCIRAALDGRGNA